MGIVFGGPSCHYVSGYLRNSSGNCVKVEDCPKPSREVNPSDKYSENECGPIEHLVKNNPSCEPTCSHPRLVICSRVRFGGSGCYCIEGYLRNSNGKCVKVEDCPNIKRGDIIFPDN
ncbi:Similar to Chymotrypsin inhibitor (Apis mellifera) [Cotesia congregata]|uniref:Similar to Chymotrypsin inhibitor (Apis mellifera) n=1 Tax=Cotesia congregata TaxID=51543 RepID=A0A8J2HBC8_COTCN|nr:Similar to Chymotrypsin inhibitor (Apis mellifera) [Cotesia congregata]